MMFNIFLILIFLRPFISRATFPNIDTVYSLILPAFLVVWFAFKENRSHATKGVSALGLFASPPMNLTSGGEEPPLAPRHLLWHPPLHGKKIDNEKIKDIKPALMFFFLALIISSLFSLNKAASFKELCKYTTYILAFLAAGWAPDKNKLIRTLVLAGFGISIIGIYQYFFGFQHISEYVVKKGITDPFALDQLANKRIFLPFITPNALAGYLILILPLAFIIEGKEKWVVVSVMSAGIFLTRSLGGILALFLGAGLYIVFKNSKNRDTSHPREKYYKRDVSLFFLFLLAAMTAVIFIFRQSAVKQHMLPAFSFVRRSIYWRDTLNIFIRHPFWGRGLGNFNLAWSRYAHNAYLQISAETGIFGLLTFIWLLVRVFKAGLKNIKSNGQIYLLVASFIFLVHNFVDFTFFLPEICTIWWVIFGILNFT